MLSYLGIHPTFDQAEAARLATDRVHACFMSVRTMDGRQEVALAGRTVR
jgi:hypothetical protein